jgi:hypothetical protein
LSSPTTNTLNKLKKPKPNGFEHKSKSTNFLVSQFIQKNSKELESSFSCVCPFWSGLSSRFFGRVKDHGLRNAEKQQNRVQNHEKQKHS